VTPGAIALLDSLLPVVVGILGEDEEEEEEE
jgi:hypothetical protein